MRNNQEQKRDNFDGRYFGENGERDYFIPRLFVPKLMYLLLTLGLSAVGIWFIWAPAGALFFGETGEARVTRLVREQPGEVSETIWFAREIKEQPHTVTFRHFVEVVGEDGIARQFRMGVDSRRRPYASPNDTFKVAYHPDGDYAFGLYHHRTWAFGAGFLTVGFILTCVAVFMLINVGKKVYIDPEDPEQLEAEEREQEAERQWKAAVAERKRRATAG